MKDDSRRHQKIVMCVDDDESLRDVIQHALTGAGYQIVICDSGEDCLSRLNLIQPNVLLLDVEMPHLSGFETLKEIRRRFPSLKAKVVMLTGTRTRDAVSEARDLGASDYLVKPFRVSQLIERVDHWAVGAPLGRTQ